MEQEMFWAFLSLQCFVNLDKCLEKLRTYAHPIGFANQFKNDFDLKDFYHILENTTVNLHLIFEIISKVLYLFGNSTWIRLCSERSFQVCYLLLQIKICTGVGSCGSKWRRKQFRREKEGRWRGVRCKLYNCNFHWGGNDPRNYTYDGHDPPDGVLAVEWKLDNSEISLLFSKFIESESLYT